MEFSYFALSDSPFEQDETVIAVFADNSGEVSVQCADILTDFSSEFTEKLPEDVFTKEARNFALEYALKNIDFYEDLSESENSGKIIVDCVFEPKGAVRALSKATLLNGTEIYPKELEDIKLGVEDGYLCYGIVIDNTVVSAAYTFLSERHIDTEVEIGVETLSAHQGKGFARECVSALANHLTKKDISVYYSYYEENTASKNLAAACGFEIFSRGFEIVLRKDR